MSSMAEATMAPLTFEVSLKDDEGHLYKKTYTLAPVGAQGIGEFELWMQHRYVNRVKEFTKDLSQEERDRQLEHAFVRSLELTITSPEGVKIMNTLDGMKQLVLICLREHHPNITGEEVAKLMLHTDLAQQILDKIDWLNGGGNRPMTAPEIKPRGETLAEAMDGLTGGPSSPV